MLLLRRHDHAVVGSTGNVQDRNTIARLPPVGNDGQHSIRVTMQLPIGLELVRDARELHIEGGWLKLRLEDLGGRSECLRERIVSCDDVARRPSA